MSASSHTATPLQLGALTVDPPLILAPMAGVTDRDFRLIVRRIGGVGLVTMEFLASKGLVNGDRRVLRLAHFSEEERPISIQIYGSDPETMAEAARRVEAMGADACDINMGCPANKILKGCAGAALMGDLGLAARIVAQVRRALTIPLTVKFRLGLDDARRNFLDLGRICVEEGADAVAMHGRTAKQMYGGTADWAAIGELKAALPIPVIGNGDVRTGDDARRLRAETGCDAIMVGRGATRNPWVFREIAAALTDGRISHPTLADRRQLILDHFHTVCARDDAKHALHKLRTFTKWYSHGLPEGQALRRTLGAATVADDVLRAVAHHFDRLTAQKTAA
ncbi:MAG: tRNA dihydrouridine synthase DusB [Acidobacteriota bacterium]